MTAFNALASIAANPLPRLTARQIIEGRNPAKKLGPISTMSKSDRRAMMLLAIELEKQRRKT